MKHIEYLFISVLALVSCTKEQIPAGKDSSVMEFRVGYPLTRATGTAFESGDAISLYAVEYQNGTQIPLQLSGNLINNERISFDGSSWSGTRTFYWAGNECDFYAIYPYQPTISSVETYPFSVAENQNGDGYESSDLLFAGLTGAAQSDGAVNLQFRHMMSKLVVNIVKGEKFDGNIPDDVVTHIYNTIVDCKVNIQKGSVEKDAFGGKSTITMKKVSNSQFEAVIVPQNIEKRTPLVEITMGGIAYLLETSLSFRPGYVHTITVTLNTSPDQEQIEISIDPGVQSW